MQTKYANAQSGIFQLPDHLFQGGGNVYVIGDVHGCLDLIYRAMEKARFDPAKDTIVAVGDLIDRGPASARSAQFLREPYVYAVPGNHEDMLLRAQSDDKWTYNFLRNGGLWWLTTPESVQNDILETIKELPKVIQAQTPRGTVGFVHAEVPAGLSWQEFTAAVAAGDEHVIETALWGRKRIHGEDEDGVMGIGRVFVGHTIQDRVRRRGNVYAIDTGAFLHTLDEPDAGHLTMVDLLCKTQVLEALPAARDGVNVAVACPEDSEREFSSYARPRG